MTAPGTSVPIAMRNHPGLIANSGPLWGPDPTLQGFASSIVRYAVIIIGLVAVLQQLGVRLSYSYETEPLGSGLAVLA